MKISKKLDILRSAGIRFIAIEDSDDIIVNLKDSGLFSFNYQNKNLEDNLKIECIIYTKKELIEMETETLENCYFTEFEQTLKNNYKNSDNLIELFIGNKNKKARKIAKDQIENRYLTRYNCLTYGQMELISDKLYLSIV